MPLSEFLRMARGKLESGQQKPRPTDPSPRSENDIVELVWENGQIVMQGQSSRATRNSLPSNTSRVRDVGVGHATNTSRFGKFGGVESFLEDVAPVVPSGDLDDEMVPWLSYPIDDALGQDYASELLPEISGVTGNGMSAHHSLVSMDKRSSCGQTVSNLQSGGDTLKGSSYSKDRVVCSWAPQHRQTSDALGSGVSDIVDASRKMERQNTQPPTNNTSNFLNFSHFSRPANLVKPMERVEVKEKSTLVERFSSVLKDIEFRGSSSIVNSKEPVAKASNETSPAERTENSCQETSVKNDSSAKGVPGCERTVEPMVASSSVGSGNSADRVSCEQTHNSKRKFRDIEESECRSDDVETEYLDAKKRTSVRGSKRSRAAEVHNLSERRRRDRINEKMRALQELIPNCNKADKASMLDEAIEYLKTLQLQVQIMSMGAGLCMPPMMFPTGMQHMHPAHIPHFPPMGVGMGYGMGMLDMNGGSSGYPIFPVPPMQLPHFPPGSGITNFPRILGQNRPVFGHHGQGLPNSVPRPPFIPFSGPPPMTSAMGSTAMRDEVASASPVANAEAVCSINDTSNQQQATTATLDPSAAVQENKQGTVARGPTALSTTDISKEAGCD